MTVTVINSRQIPELATAVQPRHTHDCECCTFLGYADFPGHVEYAQGDVYLHGSSEGTLIVRHGSEGPEYISFPLSVARQVPGRAWELAVALVDNWRQGAPHDYVGLAHWQG